MEKEKIECVKKDIVDLNDKFHNKLLVNMSFYCQLIKKGFLYRQCLLLSIFPDSSNTYCGKIIRQDGHVVEFDIDLDSYEDSSWKDITESFRDMYGKNKTVKPWLKEVVAYDLFNEWKSETWDKNV